MAYTLLFNQDLDGFFSQYEELQATLRNHAWPIESRDEMIAAVTLNPKVKNIRYHSPSAYGRWVWGRLQKKVTVTKKYNLNSKVYLALQIQDVDPDLPSYVPFLWLDVDQIKKWDKKKVYQFFLDFAQTAPDWDEFSNWIIEELEKLF